MCVCVCVQQHYKKKNVYTYVKLSPVVCTNKRKEVEKKSNTIFECVSDFIAGVFFFLIIRCFCFSENFVFNVRCAFQYFSTQIKKNI